MDGALRSSTATPTTAPAFQRSQVKHGSVPLRSSMSAGMIPDLASRAAQESSMETVPIIITTSKTRSSSAEPAKSEDRKCYLSGILNLVAVVYLSVDMILFFSLMFSLAITNYKGEQTRI